MFGRTVLLYEFRNRISQLRGLFDWQVSHLNRLNHIRTWLLKEGLSFLQ
jgi:hypothetical protein